MRVRRTEETSTATPTRESFDPSTPDEPDEAPTVTRRGGWISVAVVLVLAVVAGIAVERATPPAAPAAPAPGLEGDLVFLSAEDDGRSRMWIWDLTAGSIDRGPLLETPLELVDAYRVEPGAGWVGIITQDGDEQVAGLLRHFETYDVPAPLLRGDLVAWSTGGESAVAATKPQDTCSKLRVQTMHLVTSTTRVKLDRHVCAELAALSLDGLSPFVGLEVGEEEWVSTIWNERLRAWIGGASLVAMGENGGSLIVPSCKAPDAPGDRCGGLVYLEGSHPGSLYSDERSWPLQLERFLGWGRDGRTGFVLGSYGGIRGVYAITPPLRPTQPRLVMASNATDVFLAESYGPFGGDLFISRDGEIVLIRPDDEEVILTLPDGVPTPSGPIAWVTAVGVE